MPKTKQLVIENTQPRAIFLKPSKAEGATPDEIVGLCLKPGENSVTPTVWAEAKKSKAIKIWLACKYLIDRGIGEARDMADGLNTLTEDEAIARIAKTDSVDLLNDWSKKTKSKAIKKVVKTRIDGLVAAQGKDEG